ncbi:TlyA family RNA methyltransferase [Leucobacter sp. NPDC058333]|uniref:TlyA family RNA methyltransferase n=1 Tax=Leucobacter sp. NPDC058333 TaxID=3346450 RepID=UPI00365B584C
MAPDPRGATWAGDTVRLDRVLPELGLVRSRSRATELIAEGNALVNGVVATKAGAKVTAGDHVSVRGEDHYVGRAAHKLLAALDTFGIDPDGRIALDLGASTGGFTQVLLERGAATVLAIDVGHDQLAQRLRDDPRVRLVEGRNARDLTPENLAADTGVRDQPALVVADLSFISLRLVFAAIAACAAEHADVVLLIKPQFEVGRVKDGVVTSPAQWADAMRIVLRAAADHGFAARGLASSPVIGATGNREFLGHFVRAVDAGPTEWESRIAELTGSPDATLHGDPARAEEAR